MGTDDWQEVTRKKAGIRSKEDELAKISTSIYVTNFPGSTSAKELFQLCKTYGHVVDSYIPLKRSNSGKRFGFVRFINVFSVERLVSNLCTLWIGKFRLHANITKFHRPSEKKVGGNGNQFINGVKVRPTSYHNPAPSHLRNTVLDDSCLVDRDLSRHVMGKLKDISSISNIHNILRDEGVKSWFQVLQEAVDDFVCEERIAWVDIEVKGKVVMVRAKELFTRNPKFSCQTKMEANSDVEYVADPIINHGIEEEPINEYESDDNEIPETTSKPSPSISHPPGFTQEIYKNQDSIPPDNENVIINEEVNASEPFNDKIMNSSQKAHDEERNELTPNHRVNNGGSVLGIMEDVIRFGQAMGYSMEGCMNDLAGNSGGILCIWEAMIFKKDNVTILDNFVAIYGTWLPNKTKILFIVIYAPQQVSSKLMLWTYISNLLNHWNGEVIIMGDFNEVRSSNERSGSCFNPYSSRRFNDFVNNSGLVDIRLEGYAFTWSHPSGSKMSKLDRFLISDGIYNSFPFITAICLDRHLSDHCPILLQEVRMDFGPIPFRIFHSWFYLSGFDNMIQTTWSSFSHSDRNAMIRFKKTPGPESNDQGLELKINLLHINETEAKDIIQKSKVTWAIKGDENKKFFHGIINKKRSQLAIRGILVDGSWHTDPCMIKKAFLNHFEARFKKPSPHRFKINFQFPKKLIQSQANDLEKVVSREEIKAAIWSCGENKSPGPDGYTFEFIKQYWGVIGHDLCEAVEFFFVNGAFPKECNSSFITLIPKVLDAKLVSDYRPISLIGSVYKIVTKVLANRLMEVISELVSDTQFAFVAGRQILDGSFIIDELLNWCNRKNKKAMFFKVDFAKAYDSIRWDYLLDVLEAFGFGKV
nr:RNA-directed DNA polymerase, eukaryota [Tanacetum cinerariifolium]